VTDRLALVMIARDEAASIGRALASAKPHVDRLIVLDTGSADQTPTIAAGAGAEVHTFAWVDDFSAARNAALTCSDADWNLILDADEWVDGDAAGLQALLPGPAEPFLGLVQVISRIEVGGGEGESRAWIARVLPRGVRYEGRIHEQPVSSLPRRRLDLRLGHDGYLPDALERKGLRNEALLIAELAAASGDGYLWYQLGREQHVRGRPADAATSLTQALTLTPPDAAWRHALVVRALTAFKDAERFDDALHLVDAEFPNWQASPDFFFAMGDLYLEWASRNPNEAMSEHLPLVEYAWRRCLDIGERPDLDGAVAGRGGHMAAHNLAVLYGTLGRKDLEAEYAQKARILRGA
jgi:glycosyltransferase involved in cell wall biosynthesis